MAPVTTAAASPSRYRFAPVFPLTETVPWIMISLLVYTAPLAPVLPVTVPPFRTIFPPLFVIAPPCAVVVLPVRVTPADIPKAAPSPTFTREPVTPSTPEPSTVSAPPSLTANCNSLPSPVTEKISPVSPASRAILACALAPVMQTFLPEITCVADKWISLVILITVASDASPVVVTASRAS